MVAYAIGRLLQAVPVMFVVATVVFVLMRLAPGDPAGVILGPEATEERRLEVRRELGLDDPVPAQYARWLGGVVRGDLGRSLFLDQPVTEALAERAEPTILLAVLALAVGTVVGLPIGVVAARNRGSWLDLGTMGGAMLGIAMPTFWLGLNLIFLFAVGLRWLPVAGYVPLAENPWETLRYLLLPALTLGLAQAAFLARMTRSMMLEVLGEDYVRTARAKGLIEWTVLHRHALRNALLPLLTVIGLNFAALMSGAVVTEQIFNVPGVGRLLIQAIGRRDLPLIEGTVLAIAGVYVAINLGVDLLYGVVDPRVRRT